MFLLNIDSNVDLPGPYIPGSRKICIGKSESSQLLSHNNLLLLLSCKGLAGSFSVTYSPNVLPYTPVVERYPTHSKLRHVNFLWSRDKTGSFPSLSGGIQLKT